MAPVKKVKREATEESNTKSSTFSDTASASKTSTTRGRTKLTLSTTKHKPSEDLFSYPQLVYGEKKIGKTSLVSKYGSDQDANIYAFMFEENRSYELFMSEITCWEDFLDVLPEFLSGKHDFKACWIDNARNCYNFAMQYACKKYGFEHPSAMNDYGASWQKVDQEFSNPVRQLLNSKYPLMVTCHETEKEIETRSGRKFLKMVPDITGQASRVFTGEFYNIFYYHFVGSERYLQIQGDEYITAGHRMKGHFLTPNGEHVHKIPMGKNEEESYANLINAFNNQQKETFIDAVESKVGEHLKKKEKKSV
jgi:hypothetical protein